MSNGEKDLWRIRVSEKESLLKLLKMLYPYLKHSKRRSDTRKSIKNIICKSKIMLGISPYWRILITVNQHWLTVFWK